MATDPSTFMTTRPADIYTEPDADPDTLANLGPLAPLAGIWRGERGLDVHPKADGPRKQAYVEHYELQPIDAQTNGPQLCNGLRYLTHIVKPGRLKSFHDQVGYWHWEPATGGVLLTRAPPRGQIAMAAGTVAADARRFTLRAERGSLTNGTVSNLFLEAAFQTTAWEITVAVNDDGTWQYEQATTLVSVVPTKIGAPTPNPLTVEAARTKPAG